MNNIENAPQKCGHIALIGLPNAGKSTLINQLVGDHISISHRKVQTTRFNIRGISHHDNTQLIWIDTPGIMTAKYALDHHMTRAIRDALLTADIYLVIIDCLKRDISQSLKALQPWLRGHDKPVFAMLNKVDKISKDKLLPLAQELNDTINPQEIFMVSALKGKGLEPMITQLATQLPEQPWLFPVEAVSDIPEALWVSEIIRERIYQFLHEEIPYRCTVRPESWSQDDKTGRLDIAQTVIVGEERHKAMIIGQGGQMLKRIGTNARQTIMNELDQKVHLDIHVTFDPKWQEKGVLGQTHDQIESAYVDPEVKTTT